MPILKVPGLKSTGSASSMKSGSKSPSASGSAASSAGSLPAGDGRTCSPADVLKFKKPTPGFLVPFQTSPPVQFLAFTIKDKKSGHVFFETKRPDLDAGTVVPLADLVVPDGLDPDMLRTVNYDFGADFLDCATVSTSLVFAVGARPVSNFRMIERHYFGDQLIKSFDFTFGFGIPHSVNTWESVYEVPPIDKKLRAKMIAEPRKTMADSFYFVDDKLVMHHKATFEFSVPVAAAGAAAVRRGSGGK
ncbi:hypothetical protein GGF32_007132 [Allomyces javanicus]|nr:hypothetical protein GGF32_007132 [Allomyces javanicus]